MSVGNYVFALCLVEDCSNENGYIFKELLGTGFLIGNRGFGLTAAHVLNHTSTNKVGAVFAFDNVFHVFIVEKFEKHPDSDVAILQIAGGPVRSPFRCIDHVVGSGVHYKQFGYPRHAVWEDDCDGIVLPRPDLIYTEGYVRRAISGELSISGVKGCRFFEVSERAGKGCSGSPLFVTGSDTAWDFIGIYVAEKSLVDCDGDSIFVSYALRSDSFFDWRPKLLGVSILQESLSVDLLID